MILLVQEICEPNHADHVIGHLEKSPLTTPERIERSL